MGDGFFLLPHPLGAAVLAALAGLVLVAAPPLEARAKGFRWWLWAAPNLLGLLAVFLLPSDRAPGLTPGERAARARHGDRAGPCRPPWPWPQRRWANDWRRESITRPPRLAGVLPGGFPCPRSHGADVTAIFYPDREATSDDGRFTLEARSPHNGTIAHRDGRRPSDAEFPFEYRQHQREFRYRLYDNTPPGLTQRLLGRGPRVVWERWQQRGEDSPHELLVADDGWAVIRTHGFHPELIAVTPGGQDAVRVQVVAAEVEAAAEVETEEPGSGRTPPVYRWPLRHLALSTAGHYWSGHSWRYFFRHDGRPHFGWRTAHGERLVLDLGQALAFVNGSGLPPDLAEASTAAEARGAASLLRSLSRRMDEVRALFGPRAATDGGETDPLVGQVRQASAALHLAGIHRVRECVPFLREWEGIDAPSSSTGSTAFPRGPWLETQAFRPVVQLALKRLGEEPAGLPAYYFAKLTDDGSRPRLPMGGRRAGRREAALGLGGDESAEEVLLLLGAPDFVSRRSRQVGRWFEWSEDWDYDFPSGGGWETVRLTWEERDRRGRLTGVQKVVAAWLDSGEREAELLRL